MAALSNGAVPPLLAIEEQPKSPRRFRAWEDRLKLDRLGRGWSHRQGLLHGVSAQAQGANVPVRFSDPGRTVSDLSPTKPAGSRVAETSDKVADAGSDRAGSDRAGN
ncbi:MAG: hypothetical protein M1815_000681 [Lichina confinis]|nr:MAG: hypothetical protein M1815_000681 [Lichina confinis]